MKVYDWMFQQFLKLYCEAYNIELYYSNHETKLSEQETDTLFFQGNLKKNKSNEAQG